MTETIMTLDLRGLSCPLPLMQTKQAVVDGARSFEVLVDNGTAKQNVVGMLTDAGFEVSVDQDAEGWTIAATRS